MNNREKKKKKRRRPDVCLSLHKTLLSLLLPSCRFRSSPSFMPFLPLIPNILQVFSLPSCFHCPLGSQDHSLSSFGERNERDDEREEVRFLEDPVKALLSLRSTLSVLSFSFTLSMTLDSLSLSLLPDDHHHHDCLSFLVRKSLGKGSFLVKRESAEATFSFYARNFCFHDKTAVRKLQLTWTRSR